MRTNLDLREQTMTSLEIAELTGKPHNDVLKAIRKMEPAWKKISEGNFSRAEYIDIKKKNKKIPMGGQNAPCVFAKGGRGGLNA